ncbi:MAG: hemolysin family protein [Pseudomonadota bacterium]
MNARPLRPRRPVTDILIIFALVLLNGLFAMAELAIASAKRLRLEDMAVKGRAGARVALALADNPGGFLSTIQIGITLISIFNGAFGEASLVARLTPQLAGVPVLAPYAGQVALAIVIGGITLVSIIFGELLPKRIAMQFPETVAALAAPPLQRLSKLMSPVIALLSLVTDFLLRVLGLHQPRDEAPTQQEITGMLREGSDAGVLEQAEYDIARRALRLDAQRLGALMTPRIDLECIDLRDDPGHNLDKIAASPHYSFPVVGQEPGQVLGIVHAGDLFGQAVRNKALVEVDIAAAAAPPLYMPASATVTDLLEQLRLQGQEQALVLDEHGQLQGMVTLADLMGALVGGLPGVEAHEGDAVQREDGSWLMDGAMPLERLRELLGTAAAFPDEEGGAYQTLAGFVLHQLDRIPAPAEHVEWNGYRFEVVDLDRNHIDRVLVSTI